MRIPRVRSRGFPVTFQLGSGITSLPWVASASRIDSPSADGPNWGLPEGVGLGVAVDEELLALAAECYLRYGQYLPYLEGTADTMDEQNV